MATPTPTRSLPATDVPVTAIPPTDAGLTPTPIPGPNLVVDIQPRRPGPYFAGDRIFFAIYVRNVGTDRTRDLHYLRIDTPERSDRVRLPHPVGITGIPAGGFNVVNYLVLLTTPGPYLVEAEVDDDDDVGETNEFDNRAVFEFVVVGRIQP